MHEPDGTDLKNSQSAPPTSPPALAQVATDDDGHIAMEFACRSCGYDLRGMPRKGRCPECGAAIDSMTMSDRLRDADPQWRLTMGRGFKWLLIGIIGQVALTAIAIMATMLVSALAPQWMAPVLTTNGVIYVALAIVAVIGVWWATTPEPAQAASDQGWTARRIARTCIVVEVASGPIWNVLQEDLFQRINPPLWLTVSVASLAMILGTIVVVGYFSGCIYLQQLSRRVPNRAYALQWGIIKWLFALAQVLGMTVGLFFLVVLPQTTGTTPMPQPNAMPGMGMIVVGLLGLANVFFAGVTGIWAIILLHAIRQEFLVPRRTPATMTLDD